MEQQVQIIQKFDESPLHAIEYTYSYEPERFIFDFKNHTQQHGPGGNPHQVMLVHKVVTIDPSLVKKLIEQLAKAINDYEEKFGEIKESPAHEKARKDMESHKTETKTSSQRPSYLG